ncbi:MAG: Maf family protein [Nannocystaceae bacterium]
MTPTAGPRPLILGSTSRYRRELMDRLELKFDVASPDYDERAAEAKLVGATPRDIALELARGKARSLAGAYPNHLILGSDQVVCLPGPPPQILHKPQTVERAVAQLMQLAGKTHEMFTAVALFDSSSGEVWDEVDEHRLTMRSYGEPEARAYIERYRPLDCAGSYRIEDPGLILFDRIDGGDYTGVIGLPLLAVHRLLRAAGQLPSDTAQTS